MASPIYLGGTQMCEHGLGLYGGNVVGGWSGTFGVGAVNLFNLYPVIKNPDGGTIAGAMTASMWSGTGFTSVQGAVQVDGGGWNTGFAHSIVPRLNYHFRFKFQFWVGGLGPGSHTFNVGIYVDGSSSTITFDSNDGGTCLVWEQV